MKLSYKSRILLFLLMATQAQCSEQEPRSILKKLEETQNHPASKKVSFNEMARTRRCEKYPRHWYQDTTVNTKLNEIEVQREKEEISEHLFILLVDQCHRDQQERNQWLARINYRKVLKELHKTRRLIS